MKLTKQILGIVALGAMALTQTACQSDSDFLKEHSYKQDDSGMFNSENEVAMAINSCYQEVNYLVLGQTHGYHSYMLTGVGLDTYTENNNMTASLTGPSSTLPTVTAVTGTMSCTTS